MQRKNFIQRIILFCFFSGIFLSAGSQEWKPAGDKIKTSWAEKIDPLCPLPEYPRPQMVRAQWQNLNGLWDYAIVLQGNFIPSSFNGKILVPFAIESSLSGVQETIGSKNELWYHRNFSIPSSWGKKNVLLNFGAVDWEADVWVNGIKVGTHQGAYTPFSFDITPFLRENGEQDLTIKVWDPTNDGYQARGKQVNDPRGIWYTPVSGIWQTVWLEPVEKTYITHLKTVPNIEGSTVSVLVSAEGATKTDIIHVKVMENEQLISSGKAVIGQEVLLGIKDAKLWSPENPHLYDMEVSVISNGIEKDVVKSYFGMRKISTAKDTNGIVRLQLNNKDYFQFGLLDQGWWPDGLYTAPTDEALLFDIKKTKDFGFNMIRKHVKVESARWYYHADREGVLVWQDMPNGDESPVWQRHNYFNAEELKRSMISEENFRREWKEIMDFIISNPSVVVWVPFNERWGQFKTPEIVEWTKNYDPSRLVNPASGGNHYKVGDMLDIHHYPEPSLGSIDTERPRVIGEYGGIGLVFEGHTWEKDRNWGYVQYKSSGEATKAFIDMAVILKSLIPVGCSAAVYTQTTDVEGEINGLMTYDRKIIKLNEEQIRKVNQEVCNSLNNNE